MKRVSLLRMTVMAAALLSFHPITAQTIQKPSVQFRLQVHKGFKGDPKRGVGRRS
jgi:hypothetical protein